MLESRIFGPDEDSSRDSGKKNRTYAASLTVRARWGRIRFRDASQEAQYQRHVLDEDIRLSIRFLRIFFLVFAFGAVCFITMNGAFGRLGNDYLEVPHSAAAQCGRRGRPRARLARARARPRPQAPLLGLHPCLRGMDVFLSVRESPARQREGRSPAPWRWPWELPRRHTPSPQHPHLPLTAAPPPPRPEPRRPLRPVVRDQLGGPRPRQPRGDHAGARAAGGAQARVLAAPRARPPARPPVVHARDPRARVRVRLPEGARTRARGDSLPGDLWRRRRHAAVGSAHRRTQPVCGGARQGARPAAHVQLGLLPGGGDLPLPTGVHVGHPPLRHAVRRLHRHLPDLAAVRHQLRSVPQLGRDADRLPVRVQLPLPHRHARPRAHAPPRLHPDDADRAPQRRPPRGEHTAHT